MLSPSDTDVNFICSSSFPFITVIHAYLLGMFGENSEKSELLLNCCSFPQVDKRQIFSASLDQLISQQENVCIHKFLLQLSTILPGLLGFYKDMKPKKRYIIVVFLPSGSEQHEVLLFGGI